MLSNIKKIITFMFASMLLLSNISYARESIPSPTDFKYVNDYAGKLDQNSKNYIVSVGNELEQKTGAQEVIVVVNSLNGTDIESYANQLFRSWGIGQKNKNNGLLILVSINDRKWRVEVGTGLEGAVTDVYSARVMDSIAAAQFKKGNYSSGLVEAYSAFADSIAKEYSVTLDKNSNIAVPDQQTNKDKNARSRANLISLVVIAFILLDVIFNRGRVMRSMILMFFWSGGRWGRGGRGGFGGGSSGGGFGGESSSGGGSSGGW